MLTLFVLAFWALFLIHAIGIAIVIFRLKRKIATPKTKAPVTIIRPCSSVDDYFYETIESGFKIGDWPCRFIFCVANKDDKALPELEKIKAKYSQFDITILSKEERVSYNPKLNNIAQAWEIIEDEFVLIVDSNVRFEDNYLEEMMGLWRDDVALVTSPPYGAECKNFAAHLEAGFLGTYQDLWQLLSDSLGNGYAQGKVLFWRKSALSKGGGFPALGSEVAEDVASSKLARGLDYKIRLITKPVAQPLGAKTVNSVWHRQVRWAKIRRCGFPFLYICEVFSFGSTFWLMGLISALIGVLSWKVLLLAIVLWYFMEWVLAWAYRWSRGLNDIFSWFLRDLLLTPIWVLGFFGNSLEWQGHKVTFDDIKNKPIKGPK